MAQQTGAIYHQGILYSGGGGTEVIPNPQGEATDTLNTVEIDGTVYGIEGGGNLIIDAQRYSLEEQVVGVWIDGKPLYELTLNCGQAPNNGTVNYNLPSNNYEYIMITEGCLYNPTTKASLPLNLIRTDNSSLSNGCFLAMEQNQIRVNDTSNRSAFNVYVTIQYTKTTDIAGSGGYQAYGFSPIIYSDVEREVGVWRDNKPLYQKTIDIGTLPNAGQKLVNHNISDFGEVVRVFGYARNTSNNASIPLPHTHPNAANQSVSLIVTTTQISVQTGVNRSGYEGCVTVQYTKASDTAGSGEYNTLAIPNVHYSTDEQVIGTWIDGKTLYQKTCATPLTLNTGSGEKTYTLDISNVDKVISVDYSVGTNALAVNVTRTDTPDEIRARINQGNQLLVWSGYDRSTLTIYTTMKYTKTTD